MSEFEAGDIPVSVPRTYDSLGSASELDSRPLNSNLSNDLLALATELGTNRQALDEINPKYIKLYRQWQEQVKREELRERYSGLKAMSWRYQEQLENLRQILVENPPDVMEIIDYLERQFSTILEENETVALAAQGYGWPAISIYSSNQPIARSRGSKKTAPKNKNMPTEPEPPTREVVEITGPRSAPLVKSTISLATLVSQELTIHPERYEGLDPGLVPKILEAQESYDKEWLKGDLNPSKQLATFRNRVKESLSSGMINILFFLWRQKNLKTRVVCIGKTSAEWKKTWLANLDHVYIGDRELRTGMRQSVWHNPFKMSTVKSARQGTRNQVIALYRNYIIKKIRAENLYEALENLRGKSLGCWCSPQPCHGDVLIDLLEDNSWQVSTSDTPKTLPPSVHETTLTASSNGSLSDSMMSEDEEELTSENRNSL